MNKLHVAMVVLMTCFSVLGAHLYAANDPANSEAQPVAPETAQTSTFSFDLDVIGTSGTQSFSGVESGDVLTISGIGTPHSLAYEDENSVNIPSPGPSYFTVENFLIGIDQVAVSLVYFDGILISIEVGDPCDC